MVAFQQKFYILLVAILFASKTILEILDAIHPENQKYNSESFTEKIPEKKEKPVPKKGRERGAPEKKRNLSLRKRGGNDV